MRRRSLWRTFVVSAIAGASLLTAGTAAAAGATLKSAVSIDDGTAPFDAMPGAGFDTDAHNGVVRTNDNVTYYLSVAPSATVTNTTFTLVLPQGEEMTSVPGVCVGPGSKVVPASLPPPAVPTTKFSYLALQRQTLTCNVGTVGTGSSLKYPVVAKVRPEVPNGAQLVLGPNDLTVSADGATPSSPTTLPPPITVSAGARFDLSKQSTCVNNDPNCGYFFGPLQRSCSNDATRACQYVAVPILISGPAGGRGSTPLASPITFIEDLTPSSLYPASAVPAAEANLAKYGATLFKGPGCGYELYGSPGYKIGGTGTYTAANAVRDSGTVSCTQPGGPGTPVTVTITNPDTTAFTCPSTIPQPAGTTLPADRCYVVSLDLFYEVPVDAINDLGIVSEGTHTFATTDYFKNFTAAAIDGTANADEPLGNNRRNIGYKTERVGGFNKWFAGIPGNPQNVPPIEYSPGEPIMEGPPGGGTVHSGNIPALSGQGIISQDYFQQTQQTGTGPISTLTCDSWDNNKLWLKAADYPASKDASGNYGQHFASGGKAAWVSASITDYAGPNQKMDQFPATVEYGTGQPGGPGAAAQCDDSSSPDGWSTDPASFSGNDPNKALAGVYTAVTRVRVYFQIPHTVGGTIGTISIGQVVADQPGPNGTRVPNWANVKYDYSGGDFAHIRTNAVPWVISNTYDPSTNAGAFGDRLTIANDFVRLKKEVRTPFSGGFVTTTPQASGGQTVDYRLSPTVNAGVPTTKTDDLTVEDCLPVGQSYLSTDPGSPNPAVVQVGGSPPGAGITCSAGQTYVKWLLPGQTINSAVTPIVYHVRIGATATPGTQTNTARVSSTGDVTSPAADRTATANVQITQPSGVVIDKTALTPLVQVNRPGSANNDLLKWQINFSNLNAPGTPHDVDIIDVFPQTGANGSSFGGTLALSAVTVTAGSTGVQVLYSADPVVSSDPTDPSNAPATATNTYCDAPSGGKPIIGRGACPTGLASVRTVRLLRPGPFNNGAVITAEVDLLPVGNAKADVYVNRVGGDSAGLLPVGPVDAPETITASSFGHLVWWDYNKNGVQDPGEPGIANVKIDVTGTDDLGNPVSLSVMTDATGNYTVPNLRAGNYRAVVDPTTLPSGAQPVYDLDNGTTGANSDSGPFALKQSQDRIDVNFGYRPVPSISTTTSAATGLPGSPLSDVVKVTNTQGQAGSLAWQLLGPVTPAAGQSCTDVSYAAAPVAGSGTVAVSGDGTYTVGPVSTGQPGCYSWTEILSGPNYNADATSAAGLAPESTLISLPPPTPTPSPPAIIPGLPNTGAGGLGATLLGGLLLLIGLGLSGLLGRRRLLRSLRGVRSHPSA